VIDLRKARRLPSSRVPDLGEPVLAKADGRRLRKGTGGRPSTNLDGSADPAGGDHQEPFFEVTRVRRGVAAGGGATAVTSPATALPRRQVERGDRHRVGGDRSSTQSPNRTFPSG
jgi:hypothetical protein